MNTTQAIYITMILALVFLVAEGLWAYVVYRILASRLRRLRFDIGDDILAYLTFYHSFIVVFKLADEHLVKQIEKHYADILAKRHRYAHNMFGIILIDLVQMAQLAQGVKVVSPAQQIYFGDLVGLGVELENLTVKVEYERELTERYHTALRILHRSVLGMFVKM